MMRRRLVFRQQVQNRFEKADAVLGRPVLISFFIVNRRNKEFLFLVVYGQQRCVDDRDPFRRDDDVDFVVSLFVWFWC